MTDAASPITTAKAPAGLLGRLEGSWSWITLGLVGLLLPLLDDSYFGVIAQRAYIYWILSAGLNLVVGATVYAALLFAGLRAIERLVDGRLNRAKVIQSCDVLVTRDGMIYTTDFNGGMYILEYQG